MLVPKLRFKEFSDKWKFKKLKDISTDISYGMNSASTNFDGTNKYIRITDIDEKTSLYINHPVSPLEKLSDKYLVNENDILFARTGASTGKTYLYNSSDGKLYFAGFLIRANIIKEHIAKFIFEQTKLNKYDNWVKLMSMRSGQPGINSIEYGSYKFSTTDIMEQKKIANFFSLIDKKIELQQKRIQALKMYKKGLIQKLFYENKNYAKTKIAEFLEEVSEKSTINNQYNVISSTKDGLFLQKDYFNRNIASDSNIGYKILKKEQIVLSPQNLWMGNINFNNKYKIGIVSPSYKIFNINLSYDKDYIATLLRTSKAFYYYTISSEQGASIVRRNLNLEAFNEILFSIPDLKTQQIYGSLIKTYDKKILNEIHKFNSLYSIKKGLLQQMFI